MLQEIKFEMNKIKMNSKGQAQNVVALVVTAIVVLIVLMLWNTLTASLAAQGSNTAAGTGFGNYASIGAFTMMNIAVVTLLPVFALVVGAVIIIGIIGFLQTRT